MSDLPDTAQFALPIVRSRFLDAHAAVEAAVIARLRSLGCDVRPLMSQNLDMLAKAKAAPSYSKASKKSVDMAVDEIKSLQDIRNDIVHGQMKIVEIDGTSHACFINPQDKNRHCRRPTLASESGIRAISRELERLAEMIDPD